MDRWTEMGRVSEEKKRRKKIKKRKSPKKEDPGARKGGKVAQHCAFPMICGSGGSKSRLAKAAGAKPAGQMRESCTPLWREAPFQVKSVKNCGVRSTFGRSDVVLRGRRKGFSTLPKVSKTWGFCGISKNNGGRGTFEEDLQRWIFRGRRSTRDMFIRAVRRSGRWFPEMGCIMEHPIFSFGKMILHDRCSTSYDLVSLFHGRRSTLDRWSGKNSKRIGTRPSALHSTFHFWRKSRRIASFLMLSTSKNEEVLQNCFVFDVVKFKNWGSLAELLRFWCCQVQKLKRSRRIASFSSLQIGKEIDRQLQLQLQVPLHDTTTTTTSANILRYITQR